jgi:uncharacterized cupin superfamily protein
MSAIKYLGAVCAAFCLGTVVPTAHGEESREAVIVTLSRGALRGEGLQHVPPYRKEVTVAGLQQISARELFSGGFVVDVWETQDGGTLLLKNYPFDQFVHVLSGNTTLKSNDGSLRSFVAGESFVIPKGFNGTWTVSKGFREMLIIESKSLKDGIGQFEQ